MTYIYISWIIDVNIVDTRKKKYEELLPEEGYWYIDGLLGALVSPNPVLEKEYARCHCSCFKVHIKTN